MPDRMTTSELLIALMPWPETVQMTEMLSSVVMADDRRRTASIESAKSARASRVGGGRNDQSPSPIGGNRTEVATSSGMQRNRVPAARQASALANQ